MARSQKTKRVTRKGSKQLTDEERASQVASPTRSPSPTIQPGEIDEPIMRDPATLTEAGRRSQAFARQMKAGDIKRAERSQQRGNTSCPSGNDNDAAVPKPFEINNDTNENDNDSNNDNQEDDIFSNDSNDDPDKGGCRDPDYAQGNDPDDNNPGDDSDPIQGAFW